MATTTTTSIIEKPGRAEAIAAAGDVGLRRLGQDYLKLLDAYAEEARTAGPAFVDDYMHDLQVERFYKGRPEGPIKTFPLRGIKDSPPYLHDGRCPTLHDVVEFFKPRGITITTIAMFGGLHYENPEIQKSIDKVFQAQQDKAVAQAEAEAAKQRKEALKLVGEGEAGQKREIAKGEAEAVKTAAEAKAFELEKLMANPEAYLALKRIEAHYLLEGFSQ